MADDVPADRGGRYERAAGRAANRSAPVTAHRLANLGAIVGPQRHVRCEQLLIGAGSSASVARSGDCGLR
ncbi:hypothetical protein [Dactylosporangium salmoneum]|uniref:hypothetical protein n=1 Tax=Dactylosporangium salmoneum TaxID=53361 RepID=UPI0031CE98EA